MTFSRPIKLRDPRAAALQHLRTWGYEDGYKGREAVSVNAVYQQAWRRGREARRAMHDGL